MKKIKKKKSFLKKIKKKKKILLNIFGFFSILLLFGGFAYGIDVIGDYIKTQTSSGKGLNNNTVTFSREKTTYYINGGNDGILSNNYFKGYYYDNIYGYFRLDWNEDKNLNVHISNVAINNYNGCNSGLKLKGKAYSKYVGYINFNYGNYTYYDGTNEDIFVYFCKDDNKIYGKTYSKTLGTQNLDGIEIKNANKKVITDVSDDLYINNIDIIKEDNFNSDNIGGGDRYELEKNTTDNKNINENTFWLIK